MNARRFLAAVALVASAAQAQQIGDAKHGAYIATRICAVCHAVKRGEMRSLNKAAPSFTKIARTPGMTPLAIRVALRTAHRHMPNLVIKRDEADDIIAYLETLK